MTNEERDALIEEVRASADKIEQGHDHLGVAKVYRFLLGELDEARAALTRSSSPCSPTSKVLATCRSEELTMTWIQTYTLRAFDLLAPTAETVDVEDIAHALSRLNRFSGHTHGEPYSVAHHSMLVADLLASWGAPPEVVREGLLHDAGEAYYGDVTSPVKRALLNLRIENLDDENNASTFRPPNVLAEFARPIDRVVRSALMLPEHETPIVKRADLVALAIERRDLFGDKPEPRDWELPEYAPTSAPCDRLHRPPIEWESAPPGRMHARRLVPWAEAKTRFLALLAELDAKRGST